jgi:hypothetical protein
MLKFVSPWRRSRVLKAIFVALVLSLSSISCDALTHQDGECYPCRQSTPTSPTTCAGTMECKRTTQGDYVCFDQGSSSCWIPPR